MGFVWLLGANTASRAAKKAQTQTLANGKVGTRTNIWVFCFKNESVLLFFPSLQWASCQSHYTWLEEIGWPERSRRRHTKRKSVRRPVDHCLLIITLTSNSGSLSEGDFHPWGWFLPHGATPCLCHPKGLRCPQAGQRTPTCNGDPWDPHFLLSIKPQKAERRGRANHCVLLKALNFPKPLGASLLHVLSPKEV